MHASSIRLYVGILLMSGLACAQTIASADRFNSGNSTGIPVYPKAVAGEHSDDRGTVSMSDSSQVHRLAANAYLSADKPERVLQFYRDRLKASGTVVECSGGTNTLVDVQLNDAAFANPSACNADDFAASGTELKVINNGEQRIVVVLPHESGSEIALVSVKP
jgi:hypothetical protein